VSNTLLVNVNLMRRSLAGAKVARAFEAAQARQAALAGHATLVGALAALEATRDWAVKEGIIRALLAEHQAGCADVWSAALTVAFYPMLVRLRARLREGAFDRDDLDQLVVIAFLTALQDVTREADRDRLPMRLATQTRVHVVAVLERERSRQNARRRLTDASLGDLLGPEPEPPLDAREVDGDEPEDEARAFLAWAARQVPADRLELLVSLHLEHEKLPAVVARRHPEADPDERRAIRQKLKRQRSRAVERLRARLPRSPSPETEPPCATWLRGQAGASSP